jgi:hypothetical protein
MPIGGGVNQDVEPTVVAGNTMSLSATAVASNLATLSSTAGLQTGQVVQFTGSGITGLTSGSAYFLFIASATTVGFATSAANALAGTLISISGTPSSGVLNFNFQVNTYVDGGPIEKICAANVFSDAGHTVALDGMPVQQVSDVSGNTSGSGFAATQTTPANQPIFRSLGCWSDPDGATSLLEFPNNAYSGHTNAYLNLPASCEIGGGAVANEGTIIWAGRILPEMGYRSGGPQTSLYPFFIGSYGLELQSNNTQNVIGLYNGGRCTFQKPFVIPDINPIVMALRFSSASGAIGVNQTKLYVGTNFTDTALSSGSQFNFLSGTQSGGTIAFNNGSYNLPQELGEFIVFDRALTDSQIQTLIQ